MTDTKPYRVLAIDDHPLFRKGIADLLGMDPSLELVGEAASGSEGLELALRLLPDLILLDINMKGMDGLKTLEELKKAQINAHLLMLTVSDSEEDVVAALRLGADGYLLKDMEPEEILRCLKDAAAGKFVINERLTQLIARSLRQDNPRPVETHPDLTSREQQILELVAEGISNKAIANRLDISDATVKVHVKHLLKKLGVHSRIEAAIWALKPPAG